jgi:hypothetical protein
VISPYLLTITNASAKPPPDDEDDCDSKFRGVKIIAIQKAIISNILISTPLDIAIPVGDIEEEIEEEETRPRLRETLDTAREETAIFFIISTN